MSKVSDSEAGQGRSAVNAILERTVKAQKRKWDLDEKVALLGEKRPSQALKSLLRDRSLLEAIQETQKEARNVGEDLLEDQLGLDNVSGLSDAERAGRKKAFGVIEKLLDEVDEAKSRLASLAKAAMPDLAPIMDDEPIMDDAPITDDAPIKTATPERTRPVKRIKRKATEFDVMTDKCIALVDALAKAANLPADVSNMWAEALPHCLGQPKDKRHRFQERTIEAVGCVVQAVEESLIKNVDEARSKNAEAQCQAEPYAAKVASAVEQLRTDSGRFSQETKELAKATLEFRAARTSSKQAEESQVSGDLEYEAAMKKKIEFQAILDELIMPMKSGTVPDDEVDKRWEALLAALGHFGASFGEAVLTVLGLALRKPPSSRGDFDVMAIDQLVKTVTKHVQAEDETIQAGATGKSQRALTVQKAQQSLDEALKTQKLQAESFEAAWFATKEDEKMLAASKQAVKDLAAKAKACDKALYQVEADYEVFRDNTQSVFVELRDRSEPSLQQQQQHGVVDADVSMEDVTVQVEDVAVAPEPIAT